MENEPKEPYRKGDVAFGYIDLDTREAAIANAAYAEGYKAGRKSRDGLREALQAIASELYVNVESATRCRQIAKQAIADDEKGGKHE